MTIKGYEYRWEVEAQHAAPEHEKRGAWGPPHLEAIADQEAPG